MQIMNDLLALIFSATIGLLQLGSVIFVSVSIYLAWTTLYPTIIEYPWPNPNLHKPNERREQVAVYAGSFNPPHKGHLSILSYLCKRFDRVVLVIGMNPGKKYDVTPQERASILRAMLSHVAEFQDRVEIHVVQGYVWRFVKAHFKSSTAFFVRGIRTIEADFDDERVLHILNTFGPMLVGPLVWPISTIFIMGNPEFNHISSSLVRDFIKQANQSSNAVTLYNDLAKFLPKDTLPLVAKFYGRSWSLSPRI